jgi:GDP-L-fucose synthase
VPPGVVDAGAPAGGHDVMKLLVTGGTGFVGRHLQDALTARGIPHVVVGRRDFDLTSAASADELFARHRDADTIVHLACYQAAADFPAKHPGEQLAVNTLIHTNVLEAWRKRLPHARFIGMGSSCAYPSDLDTLTEDRLMDGAIHGSVYAYAFTKRYLHTGLLAYNDQFKLNGSYIIPPTLFGEHDDFNVATAHVSGALVGKFVHAVKDGAPAVEIWGDGSQVREFLYVKDFVDTLIDLLPRLDRQVLNIGPGRGTSIKQLAESIARAAAFRGRLAFEPARYVGVKEKFLNTGKLEREFGVTMPVSIDRGIDRTVAWYAAHVDELRGREKFTTSYV